jgi:predicted secreted hydrolase
MLLTACCVFGASQACAGDAATATAKPTAAAPTALTALTAPNATTAANAAAAAVTTTATTAAAATAAAATGAPYAEVTAERTLAFPADFGSHPEFRTEWWYVTGWLSTKSGESLGFQITFFRTKPDVDAGNPSAFAARQLIIAHCAISDPKRGRLWQDQRIRRAGFGLADARQGDTDVWIDNWTLKRDPGGDTARGAYSARIDADGFALALTFSDTQAPLLNGGAGVSRKGPAVQAASYYYSLPHLKVEGSLTRAGEPTAVDGEAWFDHEWSSQYLDPQAVGWDWIGINLDDGEALMAFRIRDAHGAAHWAGGTLRSAGGQKTLQPDEVTFIPGRTWTSPRTGIEYPIEWRVRVGEREFDLTPLLSDQENDTRLSTGAIYWEGAVRASEHQRIVGRGYLELTGYGERLRLR